MERFEYRNMTPEELRGSLSLLFSKESQRASGLEDARNERVADRDVSEYGGGATELMTPQTQPAGAEFDAPQQSRYLRQKGTEDAA
jgi:hypothetical protein